MILALETSTRAFSLAVFDGRAIAGIENAHEAARAQNIVSIVSRMLGDRGCTVGGLEAVYAGLGPGSFTGIRVGLAFANALLQTSGIPLLGVPTLDLLAFEGGGWNNSAVSLLRSRKNEAFAAFYKGGSRVGGYLALGREELIRFLRDARPERIVCCEEDFVELKLGELGLGGPGPDGGAQAVFVYPRAADMFALVQAAGLKPRREYLKPLYVRDSHAVPHLHG